jgi:hypothetical protein
VRQATVEVGGQGGEHDMVSWWIFCLPGVAPEKWIQLEMYPAERTAVGMPMGLPGRAHMQAHQGPPVQLEGGPAS